MGPLHSSIMTHFPTLNLAFSFRESDHLCTWSGSEYDCCIGWRNRRKPEKREIPNKTCLNHCFIFTTNTTYLLNFWLDFSHLRRPGIDVLIRPWRSDWEELLVGNGATASIQIYNFWKYHKRNVTLEARKTFYDSMTWLKLHVHPPTLRSITSLSLNIKQHHTPNIAIQT